uniref:Uncharacterized protein n=1 Tax=Arundo donax TaxID=35708 RepID=A0A0A9HD98_ARUDO
MKNPVSPLLVRILVTTLSYMSLMRVMYFVKTLYFSEAHHMTFRGILS